MAVDTGDGRQERVPVPVGSSKNPKLRWQAQAARTLSEVCAASLLSSTELVAVLQHTTGQSILPGELDQWQEGRVEFPAWIIPAITDVAGLHQEDGRWVLRGQPRDRSWLVAALSAPFRVLWRGRGVVVAVVAAGLLGTLLYGGHGYLGHDLRVPALPMSHGNPAAQAPRGDAPARVQNDTTTARTPDAQSAAAAPQPTAAPTPPPPTPEPTSAPVQSVAAAPAGSATSTRGASGTAATAPQQAAPAQATTATNAAPAHSTPRATPPPPAPASGSPGGLLGLLGGLLGLLGL